jgi:hypothetical protein
MNEEHDNADLRILVIQFVNVIDSSEITLFRGAVERSMKKAGILFRHNLEGNKYRRSYPLIRYKRIKNNASIVGINQGVDDLAKFLSLCEFNYNIRHRLLQMKLDKVDAYTFNVSVNDIFFDYSMQCWLPLNNNNYRQYFMLDSLQDKVKFLEKILSSNISSFIRGLNVSSDRQVQLRIMDITRTHDIVDNGDNVTSFDIEFRSNIF